MNHYRKIILGILLYSFLGTVIASSNFLRLNLPQSVSFELPNNWKILSENSRITLGSWVESKLQVINREDISNTMPFYAKYYDDSGKTAASLNVRYYPTLTTTEAEALSGGSNYLNELNKNISVDYKIGFEATGGKLVSWLGTQKRNISGKVYFVSESRGITPDGKPWHTYLVRRLNATKSFTILVSYNEEQEFFLKPIIEKIIGSIKAP